MEEFAVVVILITVIVVVLSVIGAVPWGGWGDNSYRTIQEVTVNNQTLALKAHVSWDNWCKLDKIIIKDSSNNLASEIILINPSNNHCLSENDKDRYIITYDVDKDGDQDIQLYIRTANEVATISPVYIRDTYLFDPIARNYKIKQ
jgi:hypothetical protein